MRGKIEQQFDLIAKGEVSHQDVVQHTITTYMRKFAYFFNNIDKMNNLFEAHFSSMEASKGRALSKCGVCGKYMKFIAPRPSRLHCMTCDVTYNLPQGGTIKLYLEKVCPLDRFELVVFSTGGPDGISYPVCPYCYNNPPFEDFAGKTMSCSSCKHPTCAMSATRRAVKACKNHAECGGELVFDPRSGPYWKVNCNRYDYGCVCE
jgi:DNA topoisomerase-3